MTADRCDVCGEETELRQPLDIDGVHCLVCEDCSDDAIACHAELNSEATDG